MDTHLNILRRREMIQIKNVIIIIVKSEGIKMSYGKKSRVWMNTIITNTWASFKLTSSGVLKSSKRLEV